MKSELFDRSNLEVTPDQRFALQNSQMLRVSLGPDVLAVKGAMVAYQGQVAFHHEKAGGMGKLLKKVLTSEDMPLMRVSGQGEVFFANEGGFVYLVELDGADGISVNGRNLLAFDASLTWDINRVKGAGFMAGGLFNTVLTGQGTVALCAVGKPVVLDCSQQPTYVDVQACVGWSLGANVLLKALGEEGDAAPIAAAAAGSAPFLLEPCAEKLRSGTSRLYQRRLLRDLAEIVRRKSVAVPVPAHVDLGRAIRARDFFEFDDAYTAPMNGFADARDYYARCACGPYLKSIRRPTLIVNARDDPFMLPQVLPTADMLSPFVRLEVSRRGGHVGFLAADANGRPYYWLEQRFAEYLDTAVAAMPARGA